MSTRSRHGQKNPATEYVYLMLNHRNGYVKIGRSNNPQFREKTLQSEEPEVALLCALRTPRNLESSLHRHFSGNRVRGEWFNLSQDQLSLADTILHVESACFLEGVE